MTTDLNHILDNARIAADKLNLIDRGTIDKVLCAVADEADGGLLKLLTDGDGRLIGCHACGLHAADMVQEAAALMNMGCTVGQLNEITHIHPTIAELLMG